MVNESDSVIMQLVNKIILEAQAKRASDIHIEPNVGKKNVEVRYRVDGDCAIYQTLPYSYRAAVISRIKIMSNLDITVRRLPRTGRSSSGNRAARRSSSAWPPSRPREGWRMS